MTDDQVVEMFLRESNAIEGVYDRRSLEDAKKAWNYLIKQEVMSVSVVLMTHKILMAHQPIEGVWRGHFRRQPVWVGRHEAMPYTQIHEAIDRWCRAMNIHGQVTDKKGEKTVEFMSKQLHVEYEHIHPFVDGNGRTGRMFMNWWRLKCGARIYVVKEVDRHKYYKWFQEEEYAAKK